MLLKNRLTVFLNIIQKHFAISFCLSTVFVLIVTKIFKLQFKLIEDNLTIYVVLSLTIITFFWWLKNLDNKSNIKTLLTTFFSRIFISSTTVLILSNLLIKDFLKNQNNHINLLYIVIIFSGLMTFYIRQHISTHSNEPIALYKHKKILHTIFFTFIVVNYLAITTNNLGLLSPQNDEFLTYGAVKYILHQNLEPKDFLYGAEDNSSPNFYSRALPYSLGVAGTVKVLGGNDQSISNLRSLSVVLGCITLLFLYLLYKDDLPEMVLFPSLYLFSIFYIFVYHSRVARMYSLVLLITIILNYIYIKLFDKYLKLEDSVNPLKNFFKKNYFYILIFLLLSLVGIKTHYNVGLISIPIIIYSIIYSKNKQVRITFSIILLLVISLISFIYLDIGPVSQSYMNLSGHINYNFIDFLFMYYTGGKFTFIFFLLPLINYRRLPKIIQYSYIFFISIFGFLVFFTNGIQFHDPRYFIFIFPIYTIIIIYGLYLTLLYFFYNKKSKIIFLLVLILFCISMIGKIQIGHTCKDNILSLCPISDKTKVFSLDRWNYQYDEAYQTLKKNLKPNTLIISRTLHNFFADKYNIKKEEECEILKDFTQNRRCTWNDIKQNDIIFIVYPNLIYTKTETEGYDDMYNYLYQNEQKILLYKSPDSRIFIYKIKKYTNF